MISLSIIIVSFNTKEVTKKCLLSLKKNFIRYPLDYEITVVDNNSQDESIQMLQDLEKQWQNLHIFLSKKNLGFGKGNNFGLKKSKGKYILYLNSDVIVADLDFRDLIKIMEGQRNIGALTVKVVLPNGEIDPASHRGFPNLWRSLTYFFGLEKLFAKVPVLNKWFGGYHLIHLNLKEVHEIDAPTGAFIFTQKSIIDKLGGFDKDFFMYGEDLEMSYQIKELGYKIIYYPLWSVLHLKYSSGLKTKDTKIKSTTRFHFYDSMKIFYQKHYSKDNFWLVNQFVYLFINFKKSFYNEKNRY